MEIPRELIKAAGGERGGIDITDLIINAISKNDPLIGGVKLRLQLAEKYLNEAKDYVSKGDAIQASEKLYRAAEECIKALAEKYNLPEFQQALKEGRWFTHYLQKASNRLASTLGSWVAAGWAAGYALHVWGFHEGKLGVEDLTSYLKLIEDLVTNARRVIET
ncbi:PaREP1 family protein [Vulcanisaeta distributa]|uniref:PaREP1 family protein n=1 Tax=Vulcanisaeta distributa TaxID=164451 RepID=UPI0006D0142F|nr:PaREP1 family protein [Vulcanisaeta distributa]